MHFSKVISDSHKFHEQKLGNMEDHSDEIYFRYEVMEALWNESEVEKKFMKTLASEKNINHKRHSGFVRTEGCCGLNKPKW